jgi:hypothetical protein
LEEKPSKVRQAHAPFLIFSIILWLFAAIGFGLFSELSGVDTFYKLIALSITAVGFIFLLYKTFFEFEMAEIEIIYHRFLRFLKQRQIVEKAE